MINPKKIEDIAKQVADAIPPSVKNVAAEFEEKTKTILQRKLAQLDVVTREEFEVQTHVLMKTREKLDALEAKIDQLLAEQQKNPPKSPSE
jgi:hypothetical protein